MIYLDHNATTPCDERVLEAMLPYFTGDFANPSSNHALGWLAMDAIDAATQKVATILGVPSKELVFTSGATESINTVLKGVFFESDAPKKHIITCKTEHKAVLDTCKWLEGIGARVSYLDTDENGLVDVNQLEGELSKETLLVCIMLANNETGVVQPIEAIAELCHQMGVPLFSDATQALGKIDLGTFFDLVDFACFSAHKFYGPKGIGFTFMKQRYDLNFIQGGGQQNGHRGGTLNTPLIIGLAKALELAHESFLEDRQKSIRLRQQLEEGLLALEGTYLNGGGADRLPGTTNIAFEDVDGGQLLRALATKLAVSNGSACNSASVLPSHVLTAMGVPTQLAFASLRMGVGRHTSEVDIATAISLIAAEVDKLREESILWERKGV